MDESLVLNQIARRICGRIPLAFVFLTPIFISTGRFVVDTRSTEIAEVKNYSIDEKRDIYSTFDTQEKNNAGFPIDPFDLINRLKQAGSMNNSTTPSDALDEAINAFAHSEYENVQIK